jgi:Phosphotransferase enzyme family
MAALSVLLLLSAKGKQLVGRGRARRHSPALDRIQGLRVPDTELRWAALDSKPLPVSTPRAGSSRHRVFDVLVGGAPNGRVRRCLTADGSLGGPPPGRGIPLAQRDREIRSWLARFDGDPAVTPEWERALAAPPWNGPPVWHHGDLDVRNWLVRDGRIRAVIDWEAMGVGDPACDVMVEWKLHSAAARDAFREALKTDDATWDRARGWVLSQAVAALVYNTPESNPTLYR